MPRLRHLKLFDFTFVGEPATNTIGEESLEETNAYADAAEPADETNPHTGFRSNWLSTPRMVATLAEDELRRAVEYHRTQARLLSEELDGRLNGSRTRQAPVYPERSLDSIPDYDSQWLTPWEQRRASSRGRKERRFVHRVSREQKAVAKLISAGVHPQAVVDFIRAYLQGAAKKVQQHECSVSEQPSANTPDEATNGGTTK